MSKNRIGALFFLGFSAFYLYFAFEISKMPGAQFEVMTPSTFPFYLGVAGLLASCLMLLSTFKEEIVERLELSYLKSLDFKSAGILLAAMLFYGFTIRSLGFVLATVIFLSIGFWVLKERRLKVILLCSVGVSVGFWLILTQLLGIYVEGGIITTLLGGEV